MNKGTCRHYNGIVALRGGACKAGVNVKQQFKPPFPCFKRNHDRQTCALYQEPSPEQVKESEDGINKAIAKITTVLPMAEQLKQKHADEGGSGVVDCPVCKSKLSYSVPLQFTTVTAKHQKRIKALAWLDSRPDIAGWQWDQRYGKTYPWGSNPYCFYHPVEVIAKNIGECDERC